MSTDSLRRGGVYSRLQKRGSGSRAGLTVTSLAALVFVALTVLAALLPPLFGASVSRTELGVSEGALLVGSLEDRSGASFDGIGSISLSQSGSSGIRILGPFDLLIVDGQFDQVLMDDLQERGFDLGRNLDIEVAPWPASQDFDSGHSVFLNASGGAIARSSCVPVVDTDLGTVTLELGGLVLARAPLIGELEVAGSGGNEVVGIAAGDFTGRHMRSLREDPSFEFIIQTGLSTPIYSWSPALEFTVWQSESNGFGHLPKTFRVGTDAVVSLTGISQVSVLYSEAHFPVDPWLCAFPVEEYVPFSPTDLDNESLTQLELSVRMMFSTPFVGGTAFGEPAGVQFIGDMPAGTYVFELWGGATSLIGLPFVSLTAEVLGGQATTIVLQP